MSFSASSTAGCSSVASVSDIVEVLRQCSVASSAGTFEVLGSVL